MGYDEEMAGTKVSLIETTQQHSDQYNKNANKNNFGSNVDLVINRKNGYNTSDSSNRENEFQKKSDSSVTSVAFTEPDCWEKGAEHHDDDNQNLKTQSGNPYIQFRKTTVCAMSSLVIIMMALLAFFFSVWMTNLSRDSNTSGILLFQDRCVGEEDFKNLQEKKEKLDSENAELRAAHKVMLATLTNYTTVNEAFNATLVDLKRQLNICINNYNREKENTESLEDDIAQALKQREEMEQQNSNLLGNVDSIQGENIILQNLKDNLDISIDSLEEQINSLSEQNNELNTTVKVLENHIGDLEKNNDQYQKLNNQLNQSISKLSDENARLENQVSEYANLNEDLNATAYELGKEVQKLQGEIGELEQLNDRLDESVTNLAEETKNLQESNKDFKNNIEELSSQIEQLSGENDELQASNNKLETIVGYLNETSQNLDETFEDLMSLLAEQISAYRVLVLEGIQNTYHQSVASWDCNFVDRFSLEDFSTNWNKMILPPKSDEVMEYVDDRVLSNLCLSPTDFDHYVKDRYPDSISTGITTNQLRTAVERYTMAAFNYYFPDYDDVNSGLTDEDWAQAGYDCDQLPERKKFIQFPLM